MLAQKKMPDGQKEEISQVGILLMKEFSCCLFFFLISNNAFY